MTDNRKLVEEYLRAWAKGDTATLERLVDDGFKFNNPPPGVTPDKKGTIALSKMYVQGFPDQEINIDKWVVEGDAVAVRFRGSGTHKGEFLGVPATNKRVEVGILALVTVRNGKIVEDVTEFDSLALFAQLGTMPELPSASH